MGVEPHLRIATICYLLDAHKRLFSNPETARFLSACRNWSMMMKPKWRILADRGKWLPSST